jgi:ribosomal protein S18 acetylase RimI-like enzyme
MTIAFRSGSVADSPGVTAVWAESVSELYRRQGFGHVPVSPHPPNPFFAFAAEHVPDGFWVADEAGQPVGFSISVVHDALWYLGFLFIRPGGQNSGLGRQLIERGLKSASAARATNRALITFAYNPVSISLYLRYGMYPREPLYSVAGPAATVRAHLTAGVGNLLMQQTAPEGGGLSQQLGEIDEQNFGVRRDLIHRFFLSRPDATCWLFHERGELKGYAYTWQNGRVGPVAVRSPADLEPVMRMAMCQAASPDGVEQITAIIPGSNETAMGVALEARLRIVMPLLLMTGRPFAGAASYLYCSPGLM